MMVFCGFLAHVRDQLDRGQHSGAEQMAESIYILSQFFFAGTSMRSVTNNREFPL
jgi:hypothetical protein